MESRGYSTMAEAQEACPENKHWAQINDGDLITNETPLPITFIKNKSGKVLWDWREHKEKKDFVKPVQ